MKEEREAKKAQKKKEREAKRRARVEKHAVPCPHCGKSVLDHMTQCPYCKGVLHPSGYKPVDPERYRKIKWVCTVVGFAVAAVIAIVIIITRQ